MPINNSIFQYIKLILNNKFILLIPTIILFMLILKEGIPFCYDANYYLSAITGFQKNGLLYNDTYTGYRAYLFPYIYSLLPIDYAQMISINDVNYSSYTSVSISIFLLIEILYLQIMYKIKYFYVFYFALFLNLLVLVYVGYPPQESFVILLFV